MGEPAARRVGDLLACRASTWETPEGPALGVELGESGEVVVTASSTGLVAGTVGIEARKEATR